MSDSNNSGGNRSTKMVLGVAALAAAVLVAIAVGMSLGRHDRAPAVATPPAPVAAS